MRDGAKSRLVALFSARMTASAINSENCRRSSSCPSIGRTVSTVSPLCGEISTRRDPSRRNRGRSPLARLGAPRCHYPRSTWTDLFKYPRSLLVSWLSNLGMQTTGYGVILWAPTLFVMLLGVSPAEASYLFIFVSLAGFVGRFVFSGLSELIGRRAA